MQLINYDFAWGGGDCLLKIVGTGFMKNELIFPQIYPTIEMKSTDLYPYSFISIDWDNIRYWSDTCIVLQIPSNVYGTSTSNGKCIGSGNVLIKNSVGRKQISSNEIKIEFSILNTYKNTYNNNNGQIAFFQKRIPYWARVDCSDKVLFEVNSMISNETIKIIQYAFDEWNKLIGYTFFDFYKRCSEMDTFFY